MRLSHLATLTAFSTTMLAFPALAGVVFEIETKDHEQSPPKVETLHAYADGCNLKMDIAPDRDGNAGNTRIHSDSMRDSVAEASEMATTGSATAGDSTGEAPKLKNDEAIYKCANGGSLVFVDHNNQTYMPMPDRPAGVGVDPVGQILKNSGSEELTALAELMKALQKTQNPGKPKPEIRVVNTNEQAIKNGYETLKFEVFNGGVLTERIYGAKIGDVQGGQTFMDAILAYSKFLKERGGMKDEKDGTEMYGHLSELGRFPVVTESFGDDGTLEDEWSLRSARRRTLDPAEFEPPSGYKRRQMFPQ